MSRGGPTLKKGSRSLLIVATILLHFVVYGLVNSWNAGRPPSDFVDVSMPLDAWIPYLAWAAVPYYLADLFILGAGTAVMWKMGREFLRGIAAYAGVILLGGAVHILLPITAPWPSDPAPLQTFFHSLPGVQPYASLPSMHVALAVLPAALGQDVIENRAARALLIGGAAATALATLLAKEHYVLDVAGGLALGLLGYVFWRRRGRLKAPLNTDGGAHRRASSGTRRPDSHPSEGDP